LGYKRPDPLGGEGLEGAVTGGELMDDDLGGDVFLEEANVGDDADGLVALAQTLKRVQGDIEGLEAQKGSGLRPHFFLGEDRTTLNLKKLSGNLLKGLASRALSVLSLTISTRVMRPNLSTRKATGDE